MSEPLKDESYWKDLETGKVNDAGHSLGEEYKTKRVIVTPPKADGICHICEKRKLITIALLQRMPNHEATEISVCTTCDGELYTNALKNQGQDQ